jgi:hypothetical protein
LGIFKDFKNFGSLSKIPVPQLGALVILNALIRNNQLWQAPV